MPALVTLEDGQAEGKAVDVRPPNRPWCDLKPLDNAGGFLSFYLRDKLSALAVRGVTLPGNNKSDPNLETGTYGLFSICCQAMRAGLVNRRCRWLFFLTRQGKQRVLAGYYKVGWYAPGPLTLRGRPRDYVIAASEVHFVHPAIPITDLPERARREVGKRFRIFKYVDAEVAGESFRASRLEVTAWATLIESPSTVISPAKPSRRSVASTPVPMPGSESRMAASGGAFGNHGSAPADASGSSAEAGSASWRTSRSSWRQRLVDEHGITGAEPNVRR